MTKQSNKDLPVLAVNVRSSGVAYAIFDGPLHLIDWGLSRPVRMAFPQPMLGQLEHLIDFYQPYRLIINDHRSLRVPLSRQTRRLMRKICRTAERHGVLTHPYSLDRVNVAFGDLSRDTKYERAKRLVEWYPALKPLLPPERRLWNRESSRIGVFEAISLAIAFFHHDYEDLPHDQQTIYA